MKVRLFPLWKPLLKILAARWFLLLWGFAFEKYERSEFIVAFALALGVSGVKPLNQSHKREFSNVVRKSLLCVLAYYFFKSIVSTLFPLILIFLIAQLSLVKNCPWRNEVKSKSLSFSENQGQFFMKNSDFFLFLIILIILIILRPMKATASKAYRGHILTDWLLHTDRLTTSYWQIDYFILTDWLLHTDMIFSCQHNTWKGLSAWQIIWL